MTPHRVEALLDAGIPVDGKVTGWLVRGATPLILLGVSGSADLAELLLERGADVNASLTGGPFFGATALIGASLNGHTALVTRLLGAGARVDASVWWGHSAVGIAAFKGHVDVVALLQEAGAEGVGRARLRFWVRMVLLSPFLLVAAASARAQPRMHTLENWLMRESPRTRTLFMISRRQAKPYLEEDFHHVCVLRGC